MTLVKSTIPLKRLAKIIAGQSPASELVREFDGGMPFLQGNAEFGARFPNPKYRCDEAPRRAKRGDILVSVRAPVGAINMADHDYAIGRGLVAIRVGGRLDRGFCWWWLHSVIAELRAAAVGSTYEAVTADDVGALRVPDIGLREQRAITDFLDAETARIDALIAKKRRLIAVLDEWEQVSGLRVLGDFRSTSVKTLRQYGTRVITGPFGTVLSRANILRTVSRSSIRLISSEGGSCLILGCLFLWEWLVELVGTS